MSAVLELRLTGGASNTDINTSLGGVMSIEAVSSTALNNIFDNVAPDEAVAGDTEYRMIDVYNSGDADASSVEFYISSNTTSSESVLYAGEDATNNPHAAAADLETLSDESTAPASPVVSFGTHDSADKLALDDIPAGSAARICLKRVVSAGVGNTSEDLANIAVIYA